jgi:hypothetical protein
MPDKEALNAEKIRRIKLSFNSKIKAIELILDNSYVTKASF